MGRLCVCLLMAFFGLSYGKSHTCSVDKSVFPPPANGTCLVRVYNHKCSIFCFNLDRFPEVREPLPFVKVISIRDSTIPSLSHDAFQKGTKQLFPNLESFSFHYCKLQYIENGTFNIFRSLRLLSISWNPLNMACLENALCGLSINKTKPFTGVFVKGFSQTRASEPLSATLLQCIKILRTAILDFSFNILNPSDIRNLACAVKYRVSDFRLNYITLHTPLQLNNSLLNCLDEDSIVTRNISLANNIFSYLTSDSFKDLSKIKALDLSYSGLNKYLKNMSLFEQMTNLESIKLKGNNIRDFRIFSKSSSNILQELKALNLKENSFTYLYKFNKGSLSSLEKLDISENQVQIGRLPNWFLENLTEMRRFYFDGNAVIRLEENAFASKSLYLLQINRLTVSISLLSRSLFRNAINLTVLRVNDWNAEAKPTNEYYRDLDKFLLYAFRNLLNLKHLTLQKMRIYLIKKDMFLGTEKLEHLDLSQNQINAIDLHTFEGLNALRSLNMQNNNLENIAKDVFPKFKDTGRLLVLNASYNTWSCDCNLQWFHEILTNKYRASNYHIRFGDNKDNYTCSAPPKLYDIRLLDYTMSDDSCIDELPMIYFLFVYVTGGLCILVFVISVVYRFRWHLYYIYINGNALRMRKKYIDNRQYAYDAFVAYNRMDTQWVVNVLLPALEDKHGLKLCLHDRDWLAGVDIVENIQSSIEHSRKVVLVITNAFARSDWCQLELTMAQHQLFSSDKDNLILLIKEPVLDCFMTPRLALQMKSQTFIDWPESDMGRKVFWARLVKAICTSSCSVKYRPTLFRSDLQ